MWLEEKLSFSLIHQGAMGHKLQGRMEPSSVTSQGVGGTGPYNSQVPLGQGASEPLRRLLADFITEQTLTDKHIN